MGVDSLSRKQWNAADDKSLLLYTSRRVEQMLEQRGSQAWVLNLQRARECRYVVCAWNPRGEFAQPNVDLRHGEAYLIAPITAIEPAQAPEPLGRYIVRFTKFAVPPGRKIVWTGKRNPVNYTTLSTLGIDADTLTFTARELNVAGAASTVHPAAGGRDSAAEDAPLTIAAAKRGLALQYDVSADSIEIVIRG
jgi:hypothetical protein